MEHEAFDLAEGGALRLVAESESIVRADFQPPAATFKYANPSFDGVPPWRALARFDATSATIHTYPIRTRRSFSVLAPTFDEVLLKLRALRDYLAPPEMSRPHPALPVEDLF
jgi:hypothetical protein